MCATFEQGYTRPTDVTTSYVFQDITNRYTTPLEPVSENLKHYVSKMTPRHPESPYAMRNNNPDKHFMSGESPRDEPVTP